jgi:hypothetical protein
MEVNGQLHAADALHLGNNPWYPLNRRLHGPQSWSGRCEEKNLLPLPEIEPWPSSPCPDTIPTGLSRLPIFQSLSTVPGRSVGVHAYSEAVLLFSHVDLKTTKYFYSLNTLITVSISVEGGISHRQPSTVTVIKSWIWVSHVLGVTKSRNACRMLFGGVASSWIHSTFRGRARIILKWTTEKKSVKCELNTSG